MRATTARPRRARATMPGDEARRHPPHHRDHRRRAAERRLLRPACSACGSSRRRSTRTTRPSTTSSTATRRAARASTSRSSSTRARRAAGPGAGMVHRVVWRVGSEDALDFWAGAPRGRGRRDGARRRGAALRRPRGPRARARRRRPSRTRRSSRRTRTSRPSTRCRASTASAPTAERPRRARRSSPRRSASSRATTATRPAATSRGSLYAYDAPPAEPGIQGAGTVHHVAWAAVRDEEEAWRAARRRGRAPADAGDRPLLLPVGLLPRAERRAVRDRDDRPGLHGRRAARAASASGSRCRPTSSTCATRVEPLLTPLPDPRSLRARA